ncbi:MAG: class I poly(R)-hydroxyalkanoic acid synthase [Kordiimonas sp.]|nr:class I poly(R)-hydroxyalkanoic acid synthase [Kordiimonas sp.]
MTRAFEECQRLANEYMREQSLKSGLPSMDPMNIGNALIDMSAQMAANPEKMMEMQMSLWQDYLRLWQNSVRKAMGDTDVDPVIKPAQGDKRFRDDEWQENQVFDFIKQSYLLMSRWMTDIVQENARTSPKDAGKLDFYTRQFVDAISPTNFAATNPEVLRETVKQHGQNLVQGMKNMLHDMDPKTGNIKIRMTDTEAFELGKNIATTPGKVVYQNDLIQLIQYTPTTKKVYKTPVMIVPPWINKFYILDLKEKNSMVKWLTDQGYTTFILSWRNPDASMADYGFEDYMTHGPLAAMDAIKDATGEESINAVGYCIGGTLLTCTLAYLGAQGQLEDRVKSATFFVTQVDFSEAGELTLFVDEEQLATQIKAMDEKGYLDGDIMGQTFSSLRSNDLIWSFVVNNYMMGKDPTAFDLLYWNADTTRLTKTSHQQYLKEFYLENNLIKPGKVKLKGVPIDLANITIPTYIQAAIADHICPYASVYKATQHFTGDRRFVLAGSGHIAGVVNPPAANKYNHWLNDKIPDTASEWLEGAMEHEGSWWTDWHKWLSKKAGGRKIIDARMPGDGKLPLLEDAPGTYVRVRNDTEES